MVLLYFDMYIKVEKKKINKTSNISFSRHSKKPKLQIVSRSVSLALSICGSLSTSPHGFQSQREKKKRQQTEKTKNNNGNGIGHGNTPTNS